MVTEPVLHESKSNDQPDRPEPKQHNQRQRPEISKKILSPRSLADVLGCACPRPPRVAIKQTRKPRPTLHPPRQNNRLKRIQEDGKNDDRPEDRCPYMHTLKLR